MQSAAPPVSRTTRTGDRVASARVRRPDRAPSTPPVSSRPLHGGSAGMSVDSTGMAARLGIKPGMVVQELGWDEDADEDLRDAIIEVSGGEMVDEDTDEVADVVVLWWREDDGDLFDALTDAITSLADEGVVWLLVPKSGRPGHVEPGDVTEVAPTAGLQQTSSVSAAKDWSGIRLVTPKAARTRR